MNDPKDELLKPSTVMNNPRPLFIECVRKLPTADHVHHRVVHQIIEEDLPQVRQGDHDGGALFVVLNVI